MNRCKTYAQVSGLSVRLSHLSEGHLEGISANGSTILWRERLIGSISVVKGQGSCELFNAVVTPYLHNSLFNYDKLQFKRSASQWHFNVLCITFCAITQLNIFLVSMSDTELVLTLKLSIKLETHLLSPAVIIKTPRPWLSCSIHRWHWLKSLSGIICTVVIRGSAALCCEKVSHWCFRAGQLQRASGGSPAAWYLHNVWQQMFLYSPSLMIVCSLEGCRWGGERLLRWVSSTNP